VLRLKEKMAKKKTYLVRAHARTVYTRPVTFVCAKCGQLKTRDVFPGPAPKYCLNCAPKKKKKQQEEEAQERGEFQPTHWLVDPQGRKTAIALEPTGEGDWHYVRTAMDWFSGESIIQYHPKKGLVSRDEKLDGYRVEKQ
jgi:hypothetical protein